MNITAKVSESLHNLNILTTNTQPHHTTSTSSYVALCKAIDSVNQEALWKILDLHWVPSKLMYLKSELYSGTQSAVRWGDTISNYFLFSDLSQRFNYLAVILMPLLAVSQRSLDIWVGPGESWIHWIIGCGTSVPVQGMQVRVFRSLVLLVLLCRCETWTLTRDLRWTLDSFGTTSLRRIFGSRWLEFVSNERLLRETPMKFVSCIVREHQLQLYGHVARFPDADPVHQIHSEREPHEWRRPMGQPHASW